MKTFLAIIILSGIPLAAQDPQAQPTPQRPNAETMQKRREVMLRLHEHLNAARTNANLTEEQKKQLEEVRAAFQNIGQQRRRGERPEPRQHQQAMRTLRGLVQSGVFTPEDRAAIRKDLEDLRALGGAGKKGLMKRRGA